MAFLHPLSALQAQARTICGAALNHVEVLLEGRWLTLPLNYIFRMLELEETLEVFLLPLGEKKISEHIF